jgi:hypothetical protein
MAVDLCKGFALKMLNIIIDFCEGFALGLLTIVNKSLLLLLVHNLANKR